MLLLELKNKVNPRFTLIVHAMSQYIATMAYTFSKNVDNPRTLKDLGVLFKNLKFLLLSQSVAFLFTKFFVIPSLLFIISKVINNKPKLHEKAILEPDTSPNIIEFVQEVPFSSVPSEDPMGLLSVFLLGICIIVYIYLD